MDILQKNEKLDSIQAGKEKWKFAECRRSYLPQKYL